MWRRLARRLLMIPNRPGILVSGGDRSRLAVRCTSAQQDRQTLLSMYHDASTKSTTTGVLVLIVGARAHLPCSPGTHRSVGKKNSPLERPTRPAQLLFFLFVVEGLCCGSKQENPS